MSEQRRRHAEILAQHLGRHVLEPVAQQERAVLVEVAVVEDQKEFAAVGAEPLDRMGNAAGKIPEIANADVVDEVAALGVDRGDAGRPVKHVGPFRLLVPVQLADAAGVQPHVHAGDGFRNAELACGDLARPAAARLPDMRVREGKPQIGRRSGIGRRRVQQVRILAPRGPRRPGPDPCRRRLDPGWAPAAIPRTEPPWRRSRRRRPPRSKEYPGATIRSFHPPIRRRYAAIAFRPGSPPVPAFRMRAFCLSATTHHQARREGNVNDFGSRPSSLSP